MNTLAKTEEVTQILASFTDSIDTQVPLAQVDQLRNLVHKLTVDYNNILKTTNELTEGYKQVRFVINSPVNEWDELVKEDSTLVEDFQLINLKDLREYIEKMLTEKEQKRDHQWRLELNKVVRDKQIEAEETLNEVLQSRDYNLTNEEYKKMLEHEKKYESLVKRSKEYTKYENIVYETKKNLTKTINTLYGLYRDSKHYAWGKRKLKRSSTKLDDLVEKFRELNSDL